MELDKAFRLAMVLGWGDLGEVKGPSSVRVEYQSKPGTPLEHLSVWAGDSKGNLDLVCEYWTWASTAHPTGIRFKNQYKSDQLALALGFIMENQDQFTRTADACFHGFALLYAPTPTESIEAATWKSVVDGIAMKVRGRARPEQSPAPVQ